MRLRSALAWSSLFFLVLGTAACGDDDNGTTMRPDGGMNDGSTMPRPDEDIVDVAIGNPNFSILVQALQRANLVDALRADGPFTVFAPTNDAFTALLGVLGVSSLDDIPVDTLTTVLLYHVIGGAEVQSSAVGSLDPPVADTLAELTLFFDTSSGVKVNDARVVTADVLAKNGVIHALDKVLLPPTVADMAGYAGFTRLLEAVGAAAPIPGTPPTPVASVLASNDVTLTVFAPVNAAFDAIDTSGLSAEQVRDVLLYHAILGAAVDSSSIPATAETALTDGELSFDTSGAGVVVNGATNVIIADIKVTNGIIHVVDKVLIPDLPTLAIVNGLDSLVAALARADLVGAVSRGNGPFTVFAPTDEAFADLLEALGADSLNDIPLGTLTSVLLYHVVGGAAVDSASVPAKASTLATNGAGQNLSLLFNTSSGVVVNDATVVAADVFAGNGVVHVIDKVLLPPDIVDMAGYAGFTSLAAALTRAGLVSALQAPGPFTVFAPTNAAFAAALTTLGVGSIDDIPIGTLGNVLQFHVTAAGGVLSTSIAEGNSSVPSLIATNIAVTKTGDAITVGGSTTANVSPVLRDIVTTNGVIHVIDAVMLP